MFIGIRVSVCCSFRIAVKIVHKHNYIFCYLGILLSHTFFDLHKDKKEDSFPWKKHGVIERSNEILGDQADPSMLDVATGCWEHSIFCSWLPSWESSMHGKCNTEIWAWISAGTHWREGISASRDWAGRHIGTTHNPIQGACRIHVRMLRLDQRCNLV